jgi:hypothetical protein
VPSVIAAGVPPSREIENRCAWRSSTKWSHQVTGGRSQVCAFDFDFSRSSSRSRAFCKSVTSGHTREMKAMRAESGNHFGVATPVGTSLTRTASPPSAGIT